MELGQDNSQEMVLYFSAEENANVIVTTKGRDGISVSKSYYVAANTVIASDPMPKTGNGECRLYDLPVSYGGQGTDGLFNKSIHITSDVPIVAYAHISGAASSGATMLMPVESWGYTYLSVNSQQILQGIASGTGCFSWLFIVADHDKTVVEITPSVPLRGGKAAGASFTAVLNKGQIYQVVGAAKNSTSGYDLTGTKVRSIANNDNECFPIGVFAGSSLTSISCNGTAGTGDNLIQQIFPIQAWGKRYLTAPFSASGNAATLNPSIFRVAVKDPTTVVKKNGVVLTGLINNFYYEFNSSSADYIESDKPVLVTQYMPSAGSTVGNVGCGYTGLGDPEMVYISPIEQAINHVGFYRNTEAVVTVNYLTLVIPTAGVSSLTIDGSKSFSYTYPHPNLAGYTVVVQRWDAAKAQCIVQSDSNFTAVTYGLGSYDSYAYNAGTKINNLSGILGIHNTEADADVVNTFTCKGTPMKLSVLMAYQPTKMVWHLSEIADMTPNTDVTDNAPVPAATQVVNGLTYYRYELPGNYAINAVGTFRFTISATHPSIDNCNNTEHLLMDIVVKDAFSTKFTYTHSGCVADPVTFNWTTGTTGAYEIKKWDWTFADNSTATGQSTTKTFTQTGTENVKLRIVSKEGCVSDTVQQVVIKNGPAIGLDVLPSMVCDGTKVTLTATTPPGSSYTIKEWYWDLGNGTRQTTSTGSINNVIYAASATPYEAKVVAKVSAACVSDTARQSITVYPGAKAAFTVTPDVCLGSDVTIRDASVPDGAAITSWQWNFKDGTTATYANGNAFAKNYTAANTYNIELVVTDARGCTSDTTVATNIHSIPQATFTLPARVCMPGAALITNTTVSANTLTYQWNMGDGSALLTTRDASHAYAVAGDYTIQLQVQDNFGCGSSVSKVLASNLFGSKPVAAFTVAPEAVCQGKDQTFTDNSTATNGTSINKWQWSFGDNTTATQRNPVKKYAAANTYSVQLTVTDAAGCASDTYSQPVTVYVQPVITTEGRVAVQKNKPVQLKATANTSTGISFAWTPAAELNNANTLTPTYSAAHDQVFLITATGNTGNCQASASLEVKVLVIIAPPNVFTPNGDGINDKWIIEGLSDYITSKVQVTNRYGQTVYTSTGYSRPWDGTMNGQPLPAGTYYYIITDKTSEWQRITGSVTLIR
ncbi:CHU large protein [Filimonas lacunae]|nr:CHU large protein [Filimonas lacunae]